MHLDHERANSAYAACETAVTASIPLPNGFTPPVFATLTLPIYVVEESLQYKGLMSDSAKQQLQNLPGSFPPWQEAVADLQEKGDKMGIKNFNTWLRKLPATIQSCGLLQAIALCKEKEVRVYRLMENWLFAHIPGLALSANDTHLMERIAGLDRQQIQIYRMATREALAYSTWLKRAISVLLTDKGEYDVTYSTICAGSLGRNV